MEKTYSEVSEWVETHVDISGGNAGADIQEWINENAPDWVKSFPRLDDIITEATEKDYGLERLSYDHDHFYPVKK